jgi:hypothetical protein
MQDETNQKEKEFILHTDKKDHLLDTLLIMIGFIFAGSANMNNSFFYYCIFVVVASILAIKGYQSQPDVYDKMLFIFYFTLALFFPLVLISFFYNKGGLQINSVLSLSLISSLMSVFLHNSFILDSTSEEINPESKKYYAYAYMVSFLFL